MAEHLINHSALSCLNQWYVTDRRYMGVLSPSELAAHEVFVAKGVE